MSIHVLPTLLHWADRATEAPLFAGLHVSVRKFYLNVFTPWLEGRLKKSTGRADLRLMARNSFRSGSGFGVFRSDLDFAVVFYDSTFDHVSGESIHGFFKAARRRFPFIGEVEIYSVAEWQCYCSLNQFDDQLADLVGAVRKVFWQERALQRAHTRYHRSKAERSIRRAVQRFSKDVQPPLVVLAKAIGSQLAGFDSEPVGARVATHSHFLGYSMGVTNADLLLPPRVLDAFCAVLPDGTRLFSDRVDAILLCRQSPALFRSFLIIAMREWLLCRSVARDPDADLEKTTLWLEILRQEINQTLAVAQEARGDLKNIVGLAQEVLCLPTSVFYGKI